MNRREIFDRVKRATVAVVAMNNEKAQHPYTILGSGFCVNPAGRIVTCRHVAEALMEKTLKEQLAEVSPQKDETGIQKLPPIWAIIPFAVFYVTNMSKENLYIIPCQVLSGAAKTDYDLAIMQIKSHKAFSGGYPFLEIEDYEELAEGDEIGTCGFPLGNYLYDQLGTVASSFTTGVKTQGSHLKS